MAEKKTVQGPFLTAEELSEQFGWWASHPEHTVSDWQYLVGGGDTRLGYWDWVAKQIETMDT